MSTDLLNRLLAVSELLRRDMARAFAGTPLTESRAAVLWTLRENGPSTQRAVAAALNVSGKNVSLLVDALEKGGYLRRTPHPADRRAVRLELTELSAAMMATMEREHRDLAAELRSAIDPDDLAAVERGLAALTARLRELVDGPSDDPGGGPD